MKTRVMAALPALALAVALASQPGQAAGSTATVYDLQTHQTDSASAGQIEGRMRLLVYSDGIVNGTFLDSEGRVSSIVGGIDGTKIWLQIGDHSPIFQRTYTGTLVGGKLIATTRGHGFHSWTLEGTAKAR